MQFAKISWCKDVPKSDRFEDFYFSSCLGIAETYYNFIQHNFLEQRFSQLKPGDVFYISETGFGSGLSFLVTLDAWFKFAPKLAKLRYYSIEKYPLKKEDLKLVLAIFPNLKTTELLLQYDVVSNGIYHYVFGDDVELSLIIDDVVNISKYRLPKIDAWFFDGFAPKKNESMWSEELFRNIRTFCKKKTTFATFTASSLIRKRLQATGFTVKKDTGYGKKREMMFGYFNQKDC